MSEYRVEKVEDVLAVGEAVFVKVLSTEVQPCLKYINDRMTE